MYNKPVILTTALLQHIQQQLTDLFKREVSVISCTPVHGGDINEAYLLHTSVEKFFVKVNKAAWQQDMFEKEAMGLALLTSAGCIDTPGVLLHGKYNEQIFLVTTYIEKGTPSPDFWSCFGEQLAKLHSHTNAYFGLDHNNYIGSLPQANTANTRWSNFYAQRIMSLTAMANEKGVLEKRYIPTLEKLSGRLSELFPEEPPALLHGDLWSGNFMVNAKGLPVIFDPAVYYGNREMDLAMTLLFDGFDRKMYEAYHYHYPLQPGWENRITLCQLYPLLVHLVLFGGHYQGQVAEILKKV